MLLTGLLVVAVSAAGVGVSEGESLAKHVNGPLPIEGAGRRQTKPPDSEDVRTPTTAARRDQQEPSPSGSPTKRASLLWPSVLCGLAGLMVGGALGWAAGRSGPGQAAFGSPPTAKIVSDPADRSRAVGSASSTASAALVDGLVDGLMATYDLATTDAQRSRIVRTLRDVNVELVTPQSGDSFDAAEHKALASEPAPTPDGHGRIARIERPGWKRGGAAVRLPEVTVWQ